MAYLSLGETIDELAPLVARCAGGDQAALRRLYDIQAPRLKGLAYRITNSHAVAEDVLHDVFLHVWQEAHRFDPARGSARAWLTTLVRFRSLELLRRAARERTADTVPEQQDDEPDAHARLVASSEGRALYACLSQLDPAPRRAITLAFVEGRTHGEVAELLGMPLGTVKSTIRRGLMRLKRCLDQ